MGVQGLWQIVQPCARPTNLAQLNRKRLAIDASIWIYQFLKAVRDREGNAMRSSHIVGFFRRICKLLWFGILPVFVFDGGAPLLKRQTIQSRRHRREGRREDAARTAARLLAVQMQRAAEQEADRSRRKRKKPAAEEGVGGAPGREDREDRDGDCGRREAIIPGPDQLVYADEVGMTAGERQQARGGTFRREDPYHLPDLAEGGIAGMGRPEDPRIMTPAELEEYARQFGSAEEDGGAGGVNLYDFTNIDFEGDFFRSLPPPDRYSILNAARLRSRLRMGLSKDQLEAMFPDRMAFSRFQIERVRERNQLTQLLMRELGMGGTDLTVNGRVAGEKDREYILVKNEGVEGGWALGVVSKHKDASGQSHHRPIDVDALEAAAAAAARKAADDADADDDDDEFEDVPMEGVNRLPKIPSRPNPADEIADRRREHHLAARMTPQQQEQEEEAPLFVADEGAHDMFLHPEEEADINMAIALSLRNQHGIPMLDDSDGSSDEGGGPADSPERPVPSWTQRVAETGRPTRLIAATTGSSGQAVAHVVNARAGAAVPARQRRAASDGESESDQAGDGDGDGGRDCSNDGDGGSDSDSSMDLQAAVAAAVAARRTRMMKSPPKPVAVAVDHHALSGPLPFPKLAWKPSLLAAKQQQQQPAGSDPASASSPKPSGHVPLLPERRLAPSEPGDGHYNDNDNTAEGGFTKDPANGDHAPVPLPPWFSDSNTDIRESIQRVREAESRVNVNDRLDAVEEQALWQRQARHTAVIEIESSSDEDDTAPSTDRTPAMAPAATLAAAAAPAPAAAPAAAPATDGSTISKGERQMRAENTSPPDSRSDFEQALPPASAIIVPSESGPGVEAGPAKDRAATDGLEKETHDAAAERTKDADFENAPEVDEDDDSDQYSDPEDEELLVQMADEVEEHARFANELNSRVDTAADHHHNGVDTYEVELHALRTQHRRDQRDADEVTQVMVAECQSLLRLFGIPYITAPMEAEAQCAELVRLGIADGIVTDDSDTFLFGGTRVYKNMFSTNRLVECYLASDLERDLSLPREQLIALAHLLGSDYTEGLTGVGPVTAIEILSEFPGQTGLADFRTWLEEVQSGRRPPRDAAAEGESVFRRRLRRGQLAARLLLPAGFPSPAVAQAYLQPDVDPSPEQFQWGVPDLEGLRRFLMGTVGWDQDRTDEVLVPVVRDMNRRDREGTQANITRYFSGAVGVGARGDEEAALGARVRAAGGSKRMARAVERLRKGGAADSGDDNGAAAGTAPEAAKKPTAPKRKRAGGGGGGARKKKVGGEPAPDQDFAGDEREGGDEAGGGEGPSLRPRSTRRRKKTKNG